MPDPLPITEAAAALDAAVARLEAAAAAPAVPPENPARAAALAEATQRIDALMLRLDAALADEE